jgi:peptidoglycan LD-endopeptidase CwlK
MLLLAVLIYFVLACLAMAWIFFPPFRASVQAQVASAFRRLRSAGRTQSQQASARAQNYTAQFQQTTRESSHWLYQHRTALVCTLALLGAPVLVVLWQGSWRTLSPFSDASTDNSNSVVRALLQGEQLVPPLALPPEVFATAEVQSVRPELVTADRRWVKLDKDFEQRLLLVYKLMREEHNYHMVLLEGYRSPERQNELAKMGSNVTNAAAWQSYHQYGLAGDSAFMRNGKLVISERDPWAMKGYELYGQVAQRVGLTWGGRWQNADLGHVELRKPLPVRSKVSWVN